MPLKIFSLYILLRVAIKKFEIIIDKAQSLSWVFSNKFFFFSPLLRVFAVKEVF